MLFIRHVYSNWYLRQSAAIDVAFSLSKWVASSFAIDSVDNRVPYKSKAIMVLLLGGILYRDLSTD